MSGNGAQPVDGKYYDGEGRERGPNGIPIANPTPGGISPVPETPGGRVGAIKGTRRVSPFMPGYDRAIAEQLGMGLGGAPNDYLAAFNQIFSPMNIPTYGGPNTEGGGGISDVPERPGDKNNRKNPVGNGGGGSRVPSVGGGRRPADR